MSKNLDDILTKIILEQQISGDPFLKPDTKRKKFIKNILGAATLKKDTNTSRWLKVDTDKKPNVILISLDTVRADHLGFMGYSRDTSPNMGELVKRGCFFKTAVVQAPWTTPSHFSILTAI